MTVSPAPALVRTARALLLIAVVGVAWLAFDPNPPQAADTGWDKSNHALAFAVLAVLAMAAFPGPPARPGRVGLALLAYGVFIEAVQSQIPGRSGEWPDLLADAVGLAIGLALWGAARRLRR